MRDRLIRSLPVAAGIAGLVFIFAPLASPGAVLAVRDLPVFHLPLRAAFAAAAEQGLPAWNAWIHGGQPILSNPNYAAFYPPTWLALVLPVHTAANLILLLHAAFASWGAWRLARHLGCETAPAALAATAFAGGGAVVACSSWIPGFSGLAWLPWILLAADRLFTGAVRGRAGASALLAAAFALQLFAGEPVLVVVAVLAVLLLAARRPGAAARRLRLLAIAGLLGICLAAVQLLPTVLRLADTSRSGGLSVTEAAIWSMPPARLAEWVSPRVFGDPMRADESLYFGWRLHDRDFPYLISIYCGLPAVLLALAAWLRWPIPRRGAWIAMAAVGLFLALGRHNPLFAALADRIPLIRLLRYPEKFLLLTTTAIAFSAALGWQHLLRRRREGDRGVTDFPLALAAVAVVLTGLPLVLLSVRPDLGRWFVRKQLLVPPSEEVLEVALAFLRTAAAVALATALVTAAILLAHRLARRREAVLTVAMVALVAVDLARYGRDLLPTMPFARILEEGRAAAELADSPDRIFVDPPEKISAQLTLRDDRSGPPTLWNAVDRLDPYIANLWGIAYALNPDTDLMLTGWSRFALDRLREVNQDPAARLRLLGAWNVGRIVRPLPLREALALRLRGAEAPPVRLVANPAVQPRLRFVPRVEFYGTRSAAAAAARGDGFRIARHERWIAPGRSGQSAGSAADTRLLDSRERFRTVTLSYRASDRTYLVAAVTYDRGWRARVDGRPVATYPTAAGQIGVELPAGEHRLRLAYWDRTVTTGAAISLVAALALVATRLGRRRRG